MTADNRNILTRFFYRKIRELTLYYILSLYVASKLNNIAIIPVIILPEIIGKCISLSVAATYPKNLLMRMHLLHKMQH